MSAAWRHTRPVWLPRLTLRGGIFLAAGGALFLNALVINRRDLIFVACLLIAVPLVALISVAVRPAGMQVTRTFRPPIVPAGGASIVSLHVRNVSSRPVYGARWRDTSSEGIVTPASMQLPALDRYEPGREGGGDTAILEYPIVPRLRGVYDVGPLVLGRYDPFALAYSERSVGVPHDLVVTPRITALPSTGTSITSGEGSVHELLRQINPNSDELIAREYRPGDPLRRVNWPATARHGEIMVRQEEQRSNPEARIILDTTMSGRASYVATHGGERVRRQEQSFELAIELAASIGVHLLDAGFRLDVIELGRSQLAPGIDRERGGLRGDDPSTFRSPGGDRQLLEGLANVVPVERAAPVDSRREPPRGRVRASNSQLPTFAILIDIDTEDITELAAVRGHSQPAVAFVLDTMDHHAVELLQEAGWRCVGLRSAKDIQTAWDAVHRERGAVHDPA